MDTNEIHIVNFDCARVRFIAYYIEYPFPFIWQHMHVGASTVIPQQVMIGWDNVSSPIRLKCLKKSILDHQIQSVMP